GGIHLVDTRHMGYAGTIGSFLLPGPGGSFALVESGPGSTLRELEQGIRAAGFDPAALEDVLLTHIHLDHAGAAGALARRHGARVHVHENGAPHLADPGRLLASAARIYGERMDELWGRMEPVPAPQLHAIVEGDRFQAAGHGVRVLYTPGHASHHVSYLLEDGTLFTGDAAAIKLTGSSVIRPALPPPEVDLERWDESLARMRHAQPSRLLLTHFGEVADADSHLGSVSERNRVWAEEILAGLRAGEEGEGLVRRIARLGDSELAADGAPPEVVARHQVTSNYQMTVMGVRRYWRKLHPERLDA
ncbi:MAG TPA: MBL fold metallo-hydrolase, partial [Trueperaceae bacterium]